MSLSILDDRGIMTGIAELQPAGLEVCHTDEHRDKHHVLVMISQHPVQSGGNLCRRQLLFRCHAEHIHGNSHEQRGGNALATDIPQTEIQFLIEDEEVVEVSSDSLCRRDRAEEVDIRTFRERREHPWHHAHLDIPGDAEIALDTFFGRRGLL